MRTPIQGNSTTRKKLFSKNQKQRDPNCNRSTQTMFLGLDLEEHPIMQEEATPTTASTKTDTAATSQPINHKQTRTGWIIRPPVRFRTLLLEGG